MTTDDLRARLAKQDVDKDACVAAMRGERVPWAIGNPLTQLCLVRGIRYHAGFGAELRSATPLLARAWNARRIMSDDVPYCIWHPDVASESTCRILVQRFPQMRYQVARACAVAGYLNLYRELGVLPEVHVAEEARHNGNLDIFNDIMAHPVRYSVMDDYSRTINTASPKVASLNGDTAVRSTLDCKQEIAMPQDLKSYFDFDFGDEDNADGDEPYWSQNFRPGYLNITEDGHIDTYNGYSPDKEILTMTEASTGPDLISPLLYSPLPQNLPDGNKDVLILMAAYYGDVDRYARLRRPVAIAGQVDCIVRGIFHNTLFAKWWADRLAAAAADDDSSKSGEITLDGITGRPLQGIRKAVNARFIMNNDLSRITSTTPESDLPYCIWYPGLPSPEVLLELVRRRPEMRQQAARACIVSGGFVTFKQLDPEPDAALLAEANSAGNPAFGQFLRDKMEKAGPDFVLPSVTSEDWKMIRRTEIHEPMLQPSVLHRTVDENSIGLSMSFPGIFEGFGADTGVLELSVSARDILKEGEESVVLEELYGQEDAENENAGGFLDRGAKLSGVDSSHCVPTCSATEAHDQDGATGSW
ncbi:hypothetical protein QBC34DRAFT_494786 [Podospora aff. communis PSN243]|uniref:Uncharacterized protein n=1 Tax=Podospora aff. communis PSN243 TaxID=3040156 RepID=A0AAV9GJR9_9PEZI|nr:hypothetical protein QBC34DRAFT_494786 [Podospora aff. communis PSN243]